MSDKSTLRIEQNENYQGDEWWSWSVWLDGKKEDLDGIDFVEYTLHPTFRNPVRVIKTRNNGFKLETQGWGGFPIYARVCKKDGSVLPLRHQLKLTYPTRNES